MKKSELIALGIVAVECVVIGVFEYALKNRVTRILKDDDSSTIEEYLRKKSQEIYKKRES